MRISVKEAKQLGILSTAAKSGKSKYHSNKVWMDGICFASQLEADYYCQLKIAHRAGIISGFCRQPRFVIVEGTAGEKGTEYVADFIVFYPDGQYRIVDTKGVETEVFKLKMKSFKSRYPALKLELER